MALVGNMIATAIAGNPSIVNYDMFTAVFSMLSLFYLIAVALYENLTIHPIIPLSLDAFNTLFFFCGAVATAAKLGVHSCSNNVGDSSNVERMEMYHADTHQAYTKSNGVVNGSPDRHQRCQEAQAVTAFLFFGFCCYVGSLFFSLGTARSGGVNLRPGAIRKGVPSMSQV